MADTLRAGATDGSAHVLLLGLTRDLTAVTPHVLRTIIHHWCASARLVHEVQFVVGKTLPPA